MLLDSGGEDLYFSFGLSLPQGHKALWFNPSASAGKPVGKKASLHPQNQMESKALSEGAGILLSPSSLLSPPVPVKLGEVAADLQDAYYQVDLLSTASVFPADLS